MISRATSSLRASEGINFIFGVTARGFERRRYTQVVSLTALTGVFTCGTLSLLGSLSKSGGVLWDFGGTVIPAAHSATNSSCWRWQKMTNAASPCARNVTRSSFFPDPTNILDYPDAMSLYEREGRWADAKLAAEKAKKSRGAPRAGLA